MKRPLSPRLGRYRFPPAVMVSGLHRVTGLVAVAALFGWSLLLYKVERGAQVGSLWGLMLWWLAAAVVFFHFVNGARLLAMDAGIGTERRAQQIGAWMVVAATVVALVIWRGLTR